MGCYVRGVKKWHGMFCPGMFCPVPKCIIKAPHCILTQKEKILHNNHTNKMQNPTPSIVTFQAPKHRKQLDTYIKA